MLQPGQKAYAIVRSDGKPVFVVGYDSWIDGDWFVVALVEDNKDPNQRNACCFRPISTMELTPEQYLAEYG